MKNLQFFSLLLCLFMLQSCGGSGSADTMDESTSEMEENQDGEINIDINNLEDAMQQAKDALAEAGIGQEGEPVNFRELKKLLPESVNGMELTDQSGQTTGTMGFNISQAEAEYTGEDDQRIKISIFDTGGIKMAAMGMAAWANLSIDKEDSNGYERTTKIDGHKAYEKYNTRSERGEVSIFFKERFIVQVEGRKMEMDDIIEVAKDLDLDDLE